MTRGKSQVAVSGKRSAASVDRFVYFLTVVLLSARLVEAKNVCISSNHHGEELLWKWSKELLPMDTVLVEGLRKVWKLLVSVLLLFCDCRPHLILLQSSQWKDRSVLDASAFEFLDHRHHLPFSERQQLMAREGRPFFLLNSSCSLHADSCKLTLATECYGFSILSLIIITNY